jgi:hypothetical protein
MKTVHITLFIPHAHRTLCIKFSYENSDMLHLTRLVAVKWRTVASCEQRYKTMEAIAFDQTQGSDTAHSLVSSGK